MFEILLQKYHIMQKQDQTFQLIVSEEDYEKLKNWQQKYIQLQKDYGQLKQENTKITNSLQLNKKMLYEKKEEVNFLIQKINQLFDTLNGNSEIQLVEQSKSIYQELVDLEADGISKIEQQALKQQLKFEHSQLIHRIGETQKKFTNLQIQIRHLKEICQSSKIMGHQFKPQPKKQQNKQNDEHIINDLMKENKLLKDRLQLQQNEIENLVDTKIKNQRQLEQAKNTIKRLERNSKVDFSGEKSYLIKSLVDQYYKELESSLKQVGGLQTNEIQSVVTNELKGIVEYINLLISKNVAVKKFRK